MGSKDMVFISDGKWCFIEDPDHYTHNHMRTLSPMGIEVKGVILLEPCSFRYDFHVRGSTPEMVDAILRTAFEEFRDDKTDLYSGVKN